METLRMYAECLMIIFGTLAGMALFFVVFYNIVMVLK
jgi:hypothetical protein